jgi:hypothetical protein
MIYDASLGNAPKLRRAGKPVFSLAFVIVADKIAANA